MGELHKLSKIRPREALPLPESLLVVSETFGFPLPKTFDSFYLVRCKNGTEVNINSGPLTINLSYALKTFPADFKAARQWIAAVAERFGWTLTETHARF
jgi:hypothetical protein